MRDNLPRTPWKNECGIYNLDKSEGGRTHWVAYKISENTAIYFDSFGNLNPPMEVIKYLKNCTIYYNFDQYQEFNTYNCGNLALTFLYNNSL